ncbi:MAG: DUF3427 domain-containing protein [Vulcanimicrobiota bacterium]
MNSPFLDPDPKLVFHQGDKVLGLWDAFPVSPGHALLVTRRLVSDWFAASPAEQRELMEAVAIARDAILERHQPEGFNIGINVGEVAGQTVPHLHVHVIPRYRGDVGDPTGGVRSVIPGRPNYLDDERRLIAGDVTDPLRRVLMKDLDQAVQLDIAVAFILPSGIDLVEAHLKDLLQQRDGGLRIVTGDYLDLTDPDALIRLLDLEGKVELRVFETGRSRSGFHPKSYLLIDRNGRETAYVGSSNLTRPAWEETVEWNYRVVDEAAGLAQVRAAFESLFRHPYTVPLTYDWVERYRGRRRSPEALPRQPELVAEPLAPPPEPHEIQKEALAALQATREAGNRAGLVVLATGLGKTWLSAFDSRPFRRVLFVAHREEILNQARDTYRRIRPRARLGLYTGQEKVPEAEVLFASIQTLGKVSHHRLFDRKAFDYIVVDEFHHACATTYRRLIEYFEPTFMLGLTATPERSDGGDLLALCGQNLVYRCDLARGVEREYLSPFRYFGVPDEVDYANIPWRSSRFEPEALTNALATRQRAENALEQYRLRGGERTLAFCCSMLHADFMSEFFREHGLRAVAVHSGAASAPRAASLERLARGELDIICCVDMFNEGVDVPTIDTVMMLRPTESRILWLQQLGRGLRRAEGKSHLSVIDYIGNHRSFLLKIETLLAEMTGASGRASDAQLSHALKLIERGEFLLPTGCEVVYDLAAVDILRGLLRSPKKDEALRLYYEDFVHLQDHRPSAVEAYQDGYNPGDARGGFGSWLGFVRMMGGLSPAQDDAFVRNRSFLEDLETTKMTRSYKMVTLLSMLNQGRFPGSIALDELTDGFIRIAQRNAKLRADIAAPLEDAAKVRRSVAKNPINAWVQGNFFDFDGETFRSVGLEGSDAFLELVRELAEWRLAEYLDRPSSKSKAFEARLSHRGGKPVVSWEQTGPSPSGWTKLTVDGKAYHGEFLSSSLELVRDKEGGANSLPQLLRGWFGPDAGLPGTVHRVNFEPGSSGWEMLPVGLASQGPVRWKRYSREQIPGLFGLEFNTGSWNQGFVVSDRHVFLLVTLDKRDMPTAYTDHFLSSGVFQWQSQNRTVQDSKHGRIISQQAEDGLLIHLFIRPQKRSPFIYCGEVDFVDWEDERPITVRWRLHESVPSRLYEELGVPSA